MNKPQKPKPQLGKAGYLVGKGRPPKERQWRKGQSGNPNGRPKRKPTLQDLFVRVAETVIRDADGTSMKVREVLIRSLLTRGIKDPRIGMQLLPYLSYGEDPAAEASITASPLPQDDEILKRFVEDELKRHARNKLEGDRE